VSQTVYVINNVNHIILQVKDLMEGTMQMSHRKLKSMAMATAQNLPRQRQKFRPVTEVLKQERKSKKRS
jgi:hypothetical protein